MSVAHRYCRRRVIAMTFVIETEKKIVVRIITHIAKACPRNLHRERSDVRSLLFPIEINN